MKNVAGVLLLLTLSLSAQTKARPRGTDPKTRPQDWTTHAEATKYRTTPRYDETMAYFRRIAQAVPQQVRMESFGQTGEGRELHVVIVSKDGNFNPAAIHQARRPVVLVQNAIHAGEMDGKDASMSLLRDIVIHKTQSKLIDRSVLLIIPIYNADGHERFGPYNRINQNGPEEMGWRTQSKNLNLNRDYLKADAPETRAFLKLWNKWLPDFFIDNHVTDGADYQYDTTYNLNVGADVFPALAAWQRDELIPYIEKSVTESGHIIGRYIGVGDGNPTAGMVMGQDQPRFSTGYALIQNRPGFLVEQHMLKDYRTRVTGNYELMRALFEIIHRDADKLVDANRAADLATIAAAKTPDAKVTLRVTPGKTPTKFIFKGFKSVRTKSEISGAERVQYTKEPMNYEVPLRDDLQVSSAVLVPAAYIVPRQWETVIDVLKAHGLTMQRTTKAWKGEVETYRCTGDWQQRPFEGRHLMVGNSDFVRKEDGLVCQTVREAITYPAGSVVVPMSQRAGKVAAHWLEPMAPDSAVNWGFFDAIFEQKEYGEGYVMETVARQMMEKDPKLKQEFDQKVASDAKFAASPFERLNFFYKRSPYWDPALGLYPVGRLATLTGVPVN